MNYLFRPTPVLTLGRDRGADRAQLTKTPAGMMHGWPLHKSSSPSRSRALQGDPWLVRSGSMATFGTLGNTPVRSLGDDGDDEDLPDDFFSGLSETPSLPDSDLYFGATESPIIPQASISDLTAPDLGLSVPGALMTVSSGGPAVPISAPVSTGGAGSTGFSIPGTQPVNPVSSAITSIGEKISSLFSSTPTKVPTGSVVLPGVGINPNTAAAGVPFLTSSTIIPGTPNGTVLVGGLALLLALGLIVGKKR